MWPNRTQTASSIANEAASMLRQKLGLQNITYAAVSDKKFSVKYDSTLAFQVAKLLSARVEVDWIEPKTVLTPQTFASSANVLTGTSRDSMMRDEYYTSAFELDGRGEVLGIADSGLDFDNCEDHWKP